MKPLTHRLLIACLLAVFSVLFRPATTHARITPDAEHTVWVTIETVPSGAAVYAPAIEEGKLGARIGTTPCIIAVDIKWGYRWFVKRWDDIRIQSPGNICYGTLQPDTSYDLFLALTLVKDGFLEQALDTRIATLKHPGKGWEGRYAWPGRARFSTELDPIAPVGSPLKNETEPARRIILAESQTDGSIGATGTLTVHANVDSAQVVIGGRVLGTTPLQIVLKEGEHTLEVRKPGYHSLKRRVVIEGDSELAYRAVLQPLEP